MVWHDGKTGQRGRGYGVGILSGLKKIFVIRAEEQIKQLGLFIRANWQAFLEAGNPLHIHVSEFKSTRSREQNAYYWALLEDIERQAYHNGRQYDKEVWHEHFKREFIGLEEMPKGPPMAKSSAKLNVSEFAAFITQVEACATQELGVVLSAPEWKDIAKTK